MSPSVPNACPDLEGGKEHERGDYTRKYTTMLLEHPEANNQTGEHPDLYLEERPKTGNTPERGDSTGKGTTMRLDRLRPMAGRTSSHALRRTVESGFDRGSPFLWIWHLAWYAPTGERLHFLR
jgi:hypothetical protein